jgi:glycosyltransferase involved in cell wall biosynthesis
LRSADIFVLTSNIEGSPNAIREAMACGLPCVTTDAGGCSEMVVHGETGMVVPVGDVDAMAVSVLQLLNQSESRRVMGRNGRLQLEKESGLETMIEQYRTLYRNLTD